MNNDDANTFNRDDSSPPRQRPRAGDGPDLAVERAFHYLINTLFAGPQSDRVAHHNQEGDHDQHIPPLEQSPHPTTGASPQMIPSLQPSDAASSVSMDVDPQPSYTLHPPRILEPTSSRSSNNDATSSSQPVTMRAVDDTDNDMPDLLDLSDSDEELDAVEMIVREADASALDNSVASTSSDNLPASAPINHPRRTTVEDDPEEITVHPLARATQTTSRPETVRAGSRRTRDEVDDGNDARMEPDPSPSPSVYATPTSSPVPTPFRTGTPAAGATSSAHSDRPLRPLPRSGQPPLRTTATPANVNPLFGAPGHPTADPAGQTFDANVLFRQLLNSFVPPDARPAPTQAGSGTNSDVSAQTDSEQSQAQPQSPLQARPAEGAGTANADRQGNPDAADGDAGQLPFIGETIDIHFINNDSEDFPMGDDFPAGGFFNFIPSNQHQHDHTPAAQAGAPGPEDAPRANPDSDANAGTADTGAPATGMDAENLGALFTFMQAIMGGGFGGGGNLGNLNSFFHDLNREDPARARRLIAGMEIVSEGLAKRMERVGGAPGMHEDAAGGEEVQCAVCWDSLMNAEGDSFTSLSETKELGTETDGQTPAAPVASESGSGAANDQTSVQGTNAASEEVTSPTGMAVDPPETPAASELPVPAPEAPVISAPSTSAPTLAPEAASDASEGDSESRKETEAKEKKEKDLPPLAKVVSLPCAHVFHSSCLLPWFSHPGQTTCPVCRFNIDPENLTYKPPRRPRMQPTPSQQARQQQPQQAPPQQPGMGVPLGAGTGAQWTIHTGPDGRPQWAMRGATSPTPTAATPDAAPTSENMQAAQPASQPVPTDPPQAQPLEGSSSPAGTTNNEPRVRGSLYYVPPIPPFTGRRQDGLHVHPNIDPRMLHQRMQANHSHGLPSQAGPQPGPRFLPPFPTPFFRPRAPVIGRQPGPHMQAHGQTQQGPQVHPNIHPDIVRLRSLAEQQHREQREERDRRSQDEQPQGQQDQTEQQGQPQRTAVQFGMTGGMLNQQGNLITVNVDFFIAPTAPEPNGVRPGGQGPGQEAPSSTGEAQGAAPANPASQPDIANVNPVDSAQQDTQAQGGRQQAPQVLNFFDIFTRNVPFIPVVGTPAGTGAGSGSRSRSAPARRRERKDWTPPPPPGLTLRQRIEKRERESGLRCDDVSCGLGPTDDDPLPQWSVDMLKTIAIYRDGAVGGGAEPVCVHRFHSTCLVDAGRVAGWGVRAEYESVEVSCPICRTVGHVEREEWDAAERASRVAFS